METILVTGATGLVGKSLVSFLENRGFEVLKLSRHRNDDPNSFYWNIDQAYIDPQAIKKTDYIVHLAGTSIAERRWSRKQKKKILNSRTLTANLLYHKCLEFNASVKGIIGISGVGYYGNKTVNKIYTESDRPGKDFLANVCKKWESATSRFESLPTRTVILRSGVVFSDKGGALSKMSRPTKMGLGAPIGTGLQFMPWIHIHDLCNMIYFTITKDHVSGVFNAVAPEHVTNKQLTHSIAERLGKKIRLPNIPAILLKWRFGEMATILLEGSRIAATKITDTGFEFKYKTINESLDQLLGK
jgi:uncharacterized protein (TIGR01777 family)